MVIDTREMSVTELAEAVSVLAEQLDLEVELFDKRVLTLRGYMYKPTHITIEGSTRNYPTTRKGMVDALAYLSDVGAERMAQWAREADACVEAMEEDLPF